MIEYTTTLVEIQQMKVFVCDKCGKKYTGEEEDSIDLQETYSIRFVGGYSLVFCDMSEVSCDLCQHCLKELIGDFCRYNED